MNFQNWWQIEGSRLAANDLDLAQAAFEEGERRHEIKLKACIETLQEMATIINNTPLNDCKTEVNFNDVRKQNKAMDQIHDLILQLLDTCKAKEFTEKINSTDSLNCVITPFGTPLPHEKSKLKIPYFAGQPNYVKGITCPECGCQEHKQGNSLGEYFRICAKCNQEWWIDINYAPKQLTGT